MATLAFNQLHFTKILFKELLITFLDIPQKEPVIFFEPLHKGLPVTYSEPCARSKMEHFAKIVNGFCSNLDASQGSGYAFSITTVS